MRIIITRHGETEENKLGIMQGHLPGKLSSKGISQAKKLAKRLKTENLDFIYSSDLARAADTAKEIAKYHKNTPIKFTKEIREKHHGEFQGKRKDEIKWDKKSAFPQPKKGESEKKLYKRAEKFIHKLIHKHPEDNILLVCHGGIALTLISVITGQKLNTMNRLYNTSINIFEIDEDRNHKIICNNCIKHLKS
jgi:probable phosphoglycerate mutase